MAAGGGGRMAYAAPVAVSLPGLKFPTLRPAAPVAPAIVPIAPPPPVLVIPPTTTVTPAPVTPPPVAVPVTDTQGLPGVSSLTVSVDPTNPGAATGAPAAAAAAPDWTPVAWAVGLAVALSVFGARRRRR